jgi:hypothetical protein
MNKFGKPTDEEYLAVRDVVMDMVEAAPGIVESRVQGDSTPSTSYVDGLAEL